MVSISCVVVAGGLSRRFGRDKRDLMLDERNFLDIAINNAIKISSDVIVSLRDKEQIGRRLSEVRYVFDSTKDCGPLFGLSSALKYCRGELVALLPVDAPLLHHEIYGIMMDLLKNDKSIVAVVPNSQNGPEPLLGIYNVKDFQRAVEKAIQSEKTRVMDAVSMIEGLKFLDTKNFRSVDPKLLSFYNVNTELDLEKIKELLE